METGGRKVFEEMRIRAKTLDGLANAAALDFVGVSVISGFLSPTY